MRSQAILHAGDDHPGLIEGSYDILDTNGVSPRRIENACHRESVNLFPKSQRETRVNPFCGKTKFCVKPYRRRVVTKNIKLEPVVERQYFGRADKRRHQHRPNTLAVKFTVDKKGDGSHVGPTATTRK